MINTLVFMSFKILLKVRKKDILNVFLLFVYCFNVLKNVILSYIFDYYLGKRKLFILKLNKF